MYQQSNLGKHVQLATPLDVLYKPSILPHDNTPHATYTGDADYNDVVDAARIAGHKVHLYHSHAVAQTLQGNVDHHEAWQTFLARKSGKSVQDLEDSGFALRMASPAASRSSGRLSRQP